MARVHLLDDELINKIAAGEVVERPASVVKELVENAIDAGATHVKVILKDGGRALIQVQDDGLGMGAEDAVMAVKRHTTSKLRAVDDLFQVKTMGFRGEALASIASVSRFTLQTQSREQHGHRVQIEDGKQTDSAWQGSPGTTMTVADLFYNVPARRAFLKTAAAEFAACHEYMQALALSLPGIGFTLLHNDREIFSVSPALNSEGPLRGEVVMRARAAAMIGSEDAGRLIYVQRPDRHGLVEALISPPGLDRSTARHCFTFVNGRWVRDKLLRFALQRGYHSHLMKGKFPIAMVYLYVDPALVDVNVHPTKAELRFQYAQEVQNAVVHAIREALRDGTWASANPPMRNQDSPREESLETFAATHGANTPDDFDLYLPQSEETKRTVMRFENESARSGATARTGAKQEARVQATSRGAGRATGLDFGADSLGRESAMRGVDYSSGRDNTSSRDASSRDASSRDASSRDASNRDTSSRDTSGRDTSGRDTSSRDASSRDASSRDTSSRDASSRDASSRDTSSRDTSSRDTSSRDTSSRDTSSRDTSSRDTSSRDATSFHKTPVESSPARGAASAPRLELSNTSSAQSAPRAPDIAGSQPISAVAQLRARMGQTLHGGSVPSPDGQSTIPWSELEYIGPFAKCFLLFEHKQQMLAIDQHAFHERVLYERLVENPDILRRTQPLLMPDVLTFSPVECERLIHMKDALAALGIQMQGVSETEVEVTSVPSLLVNKDLNSLLSAILGGKDQPNELAHDVLATMACHAAVRAGEELPEADLKTLLREAETVNFYHNCPHGRRVFRWWKLAQVAAWFDR